VKECLLFVDRSKKHSYYPGRIEDYVPVSEYTVIANSLIFMS